jgi:hypothetical protein
MSATGMGLVEEDREAEIIPGTDLGNIWGMLLACILAYC